MFQRVSRRKIGRVGQKESRMMVHGGLEICRTSKSTSSQYSLLSWICISTSRTEFSSFNGPATSMQRMVNSHSSRLGLSDPKPSSPTFNLLPLLLSGLSLLIFATHCSHRSSRILEIGIPLTLPSSAHPPSSSSSLPFTDKKCPWTGLVSIRGRILTGRVVSNKMTRTVVIRREYLHYVPKYNRYEKRHKNLAAHCSPAFRVEIGDDVTVGEFL